MSAMHSAFHKEVITMKTQSFFKSFLLGSVFLSGAAFATTNPEENIVGKWEYSQTFCKEGNQTINNASPGQTFVFSFDKMGTGEVEFSILKMLPMEEGHNMSCTINVKSTISYSINNNILNINSEAQSPIISFPDCPKLQAVANTITISESEPSSTTYQFSFSTDGTQMNTWSDNTMLCGENDTAVAEYIKL